MLQFHHISREMQNIISELFSGFSTSIATKTFVTSPLQVEKGVLQGDCLSPLLFNMLFNTFIQTLTKSKEFDQLNYRYDNIIQPRNWFQFADDAAAVTSSEYENQILLNVFTRWCNWSGMTIRVDKCKTFGIKKMVTRSVQFKPKLFLVREQVPTVDMDKSFKYLGRWYNFEMDDAEHKANVIQLTNDMLMKTESLPLHPRNKILLYSRYLHSKLSWDLTVADTDKTWIVNNIDNICRQFIRRWLEIPPSGTFDSILLSREKFGSEVADVSTKLPQCQVTVRKCFRSSPNLDIQQLADMADAKTKQYDIFRASKEVLKEVRKTGAGNLASKLNTQGAVIRYVWSEVLQSSKNAWFAVQGNLSRNLHNFTVRYLNNTLPHLSNMFTWGLAETKLCPLCNNIQSLLHVVAGCAVSLDRYTWRHNSVLNYIATFFKRFARELYADVSNFSSPSIITGEEMRPDLLIILDRSKMFVVELTIGFESNIAKKEVRKRNKYKNLTQSLKSSYDQVKYINLSLGACGIIGKGSKSFFDLLEELKIPDNEKHFLTKRIINISIRTTYYVFCMRNKEWSNPELLQF